MKNDEREVGDPEADAMLAVIEYHLEREVEESAAATRIGVMYELIAQLGDLVESRHGMARADAHIFAFEDVRGVIGRSGEVVAMEYARGRVLQLRLMVPLVDRACPTKVREVCG